MRPKMLVGYPSALSHIAKYAEEKGKIGNKENFANASLLAMIRRFTRVRQGR